MGNIILCEFCQEIPGDGILIENPNSMIIFGDIHIPEKMTTLYTCIDCLKMNIENW